MIVCDYCGEELLLILEFDCSIYYRCPKCKTLWDSMNDDAKNEEIMIDVGAVLEELRTKNIAS